MIIWFKGIDGCGKTTQIKMLIERLRQDGYDSEVVKHPGQTKFGQEIRNLILHGTQPKSSIAHRLLFWADFAETTAHYYKDKRMLIFDRHPYFSDYAYGLGLNNNQDEAKALG